MARVTRTSGARSSRFAFRVFARSRIARRPHARASALTLLHRRWHQVIRRLVNRDCVLMVVEPGDGEEADMEGTALVLTARCAGRVRLLASGAHPGGGA